jgi:hypothetical protein
MMRTLACFVTLAVAAGANADTLLLPTGQGGQINVNTNEVAIISSYRQSPGPAPYYTEVVQAGTTNTLYLGSAGETSLAGFTGPIQLNFQSPAAHFVQYRQLSASVFQSLVLRYGVTNTISIPDGKTLRFFSLVPPPGHEMSLAIDARQSTNIYQNLVLFPGMELSGPLDLTFRVKFPDPGAAVYTYYITEAFLTLPGPRLLQGPTGGFQISVEKSADLSNWFPVILQSTTADQKAFFRLKLSQ